MLSQKFDISNFYKGLEFQNVSEAITIQTFLEGWNLKRLWNFKSTTSEELRFSKRFKFFEFSNAQKICKRNSLNGFRKVWKGLKTVFFRENIQFKKNNKTLNAKFVASIRERQSSAMAWNIKPTSQTFVVVTGWHLAWKPELLKNSCYKGG